MHLYIDYRGLNKITIKNQYLLPLISKLLDCFSNTKVFTKLDLRDTYYYLYICKEDKQKIVFKIYYSLFEYLVILFRLANVLATFQSYINRALASLVDNIYIIYLDNILIYSKNKKEYKEYIKLVLQRLYKQKLYIKLLKYNFYTKQVEFLEFVIILDSIVIDK